MIHVKKTDHSKYLIHSRRELNDNNKGFEKSLGVLQLNIIF